MARRRIRAIQWAIQWAIQAGISWHVPSAHLLTRDEAGAVIIHDMLIAVDQDIIGAQACFAGLGDLRTFAGRCVRPADIASADALIIRSVTRVDAGLLTGSRIGFVGTATSGIDHVDTAYLKQAGITFSSAAGCNTRAVAEYVLATVLVMAKRLQFDPTTRTMGVVGVGRIGSVVADWAQALGMEVLLCDPPLRRRTGDAAFIDLHDLLARSDVVSLHVPLNRTGEDATWDMIDDRWLSSLKPGAILINTSRGEVVREDHLLEAIESGRLAGVVLDVWRNEPTISAELALRADIATPHIAGSTREAKHRAPLMIRDALEQHVDLWHRRPAGHRPESRAVPGPVPASRVVPDPVPHHPWSWDMPSIDGDAALALVPIETEGLSGNATGRTQSDDAWRDVAAVIEQACDVFAPDTAFRSTLLGADASREFDLIRKASASRREFTSHQVGAGEIQPAARKFLSTIGFLFDNGRDDSAA